MNFGPQWWPYLASGTKAIILNVTATNPTQAGYLTVYPAGQPQPLASNLNFVPGQTVPNRVIVGLGTGGQVTITNGPGTVDVVVDLTGSFSAGPGSAYIDTTPYRFFDSRICKCKMPPNTVYDFTLTGPTIMGLSLNVTATNPSAYGFLTVYGDNGQFGAEQIPSSSDLNFTPGETVANMTPLAIPPAGPPQALNVYNGYGYTDVVIDVNGMYGPAASGLQAIGGPTMTPVTSREPTPTTTWPANNLPTTIRAAA